MMDQWLALTSATTAAGCWRHHVTGQSDYGVPPTQTLWWYSRRSITTLSLNLIVPLKPRFVWFSIELMYWTTYRQSNLHQNQAWSDSLLDFSRSCHQIDFFAIFPAVRFLFTRLSCRFLLFLCFSTSFTFCSHFVPASRSRFEYLSKLTVRLKRFIWVTGFQCNQLAYHCNIIYVLYTRSSVLELVS